MTEMSATAPNLVTEMSKANTSFEKAGKMTMPRVTALENAMKVAPSKSSFGNEGMPG